MLLLPLVSSVERSENNCSLYTVCVINGSYTNVHTVMYSDILQERFPHIQTDDFIVATAALNYAARPNSENTAAYTVYKYT